MGKGIEDMNIGDYVVCINQEASGPAWYYGKTYKLVFDHPYKSLGPPKGIHFICENGTPIQLDIYDTEFSEPKFIVFNEIKI